MKYDTLHSKKRVLITKIKIIYFSFLKETEIVHHFYRTAVKCWSVIAVVGEPPVFSNVIKEYLTFPLLIYI